MEIYYFILHSQIGYCWLAYINKFISCFILDIVHGFVLKYRK